MKAWRYLSVTSAAALLGACAGLAGNTSYITLTGNQEVPPVSTVARGSGTFTVGLDGLVTGSVTTEGLAGVAAHIHSGRVGTNGPVIVPLVKSAENIWAVPQGAKLTEAQRQAYVAGELYVNVHTAANKGGEIRAQLVPGDVFQYGR